MKIKCIERNVTGSSNSRQMRSEGMIPGVIYGKEQKTVNISVSRKDLENILKKFGTNAVLDIECGGESYHTILKDMQYDIFNSNILSVDFNFIVSGQKIHVTVPVVLENSEKAQKKGALVHNLNEVVIECIPSKIPKSISVDASEMEIHDSLTVGDIVVSDDVKILTPPDEIIVSLASAAIEEEPEEEERITDELTEISDEPELIE